MQHHSLIHTYIHAFVHSCPVDFTELNVGFHSSLCPDLPLTFEHFLPAFHSNVQTFFFNTVFVLDKKYLMFFALLYQ